MILTLAYRSTNILDNKINALRKHYEVDVLGFSVSASSVYAMLDITEMNTWDPEEGEEPFDLPTDPSSFLLN